MKQIKRRNNVIFLACSIVDTLKTWFLRWDWSNWSEQFNRESDTRVVCIV